MPPTLERLETNAEFADLDRCTSGFQATLSQPSDCFFSSPLCCMGDQQVERDGLRPEDGDSALVARKLAAVGCRPSALAGRCIQGLDANDPSFARRTSVVTHTRRTLGGLCCVWRSTRRSSGLPSKEDVAAGAGAGSAEAVPRACALVTCGLKADDCPRANPEDDRGEVVKTVPAGFGCNRARRCRSVSPPPSLSKNTRWMRVGAEGALCSPCALQEEESLASTDLQGALCTLWTRCGTSVTFLADCRCFTVGLVTGSPPAHGPSSCTQIAPPAKSPSFLLAVFPSAAAASAPESALACLSASTAAAALQLSITPPPLLPCICRHRRVAPDAVKGGPGCLNNFCFCKRSGNMQRICFPEKNKIRVAPHWLKSKNSPLGLLTAALLYSTLSRARQVSW